MQIEKFRKEFMGKHYKPLVGSVSCYFADTLTRKALVFDEFIIDKKYRSQGYGTILMKEVIRMAKKHKVDCIEATVKKDNKKALKFYEKFGCKDRKNIALRLWLR